LNIFHSADICCLPKQNDSLLCYFNAALPVVANRIKEQSESRVIEAERRLNQCGKTCSDHICIFGLCAVHYALDGVVRCMQLRKFHTRSDQMVHARGDDDR
jgi:hypothetical protein